MKHCSQFRSYSNIWILFLLSGLFVLFVPPGLAQSDPDTVMTEDTSMIEDTVITASPWTEEAVPVMNDALLQELEEQKEQQVHQQLRQDSVVLPQQLQAGADGQVKGIVIAQDTREPVSQATIQYEGDGGTYLAETGESGLFTLKDLKAGIYTVKVYRKGYSPWKQEGVKIAKTGEVREILLNRRMLKGRLIKVAAPRSGGSKAALLAQRKQGGLVMEGVSAEQISKSTDSDAGAIARRVTGTSLVGGKYVFVRGLGERYTNMSLNGLPVPSPEKDKRVVPQDLFPAGALESFAIYKTFSPELLPDFAGGSVALVTKGIPDKDYFKVKAGVGMRMYPGQSPFTSLGEDRLDYYDDDGVVTYFGYDNGTRQLPEGVPEIVTNIDEPEDRAAWASKFNNYMDPDTSKVYPDQSFGLAMGKVFRLDDYRRWGGILDLSFSNKYKSQTGLRNKVYTTNVRALAPKPAFPDANCEETPENCYRATIRDTVNGESEPLLTIEKGIDQTITTGEYSTRISALANAGYESPDNILWFKSLYAHLSKDKTIYNKSEVIPGTNGSQDDPIEERFLLEYSARSLSTAQIGGGHFIGKGVLDSLSWASGVAFTTGTIPDSKKYNWASGSSRRVFDADTVIRGIAYKQGDTAYVRDSLMRYDIRSPYGTRAWEEFYELGVSGRTDFYLIVPPSWIREDTLYKDSSRRFSYFALPRIQTGLLWNFKSREYDMLRYDWDGVPVEKLETKAENFEYVKELHHPDSVAASILELGRGFKTTPKDFDTYLASEGSVAGYVKQDVGATFWGVPVDLHAGLRYEYFYLNFDAPYTGEEADKDTAITIRNREHQFYPAVGLDFGFIKDTKTRLAYARTVVRPEVRERAPTFFFDTEDEIEVIGNPDLNNTVIHHYDLRFDWFMPHGQLSSVSLFYKHFLDPIEAIVDGNLSPERKRFQNAEMGYSRGVEFEIDLNLEKVMIFAPEWLRNGLSLYANAAFIQSGVEIDTTQKGASLLTSSERSMMGQSPYLINVKLNHEKEWGGVEFLNGLLFNMAGRRISSLGVDDVPDVYEEAFPSLDYLHKASWGSHSLSVKVQNLLDASVKFTVTDFHHSLDYETISDAKRDELYKDLPRTIIVKEEFPGISLSASYTYSF